MTTQDAREWVNCELCGNPMPPGEEMFKFHGYSGPCPEPLENRVTAIQWGPAHGDYQADPAAAMTQQDARERAWRDA